MSPSRADHPAPDTPSDEGLLGRISCALDADLEGGGDLDQLVERWKADPAVRRAWSDYHHIGDVLRSDELAGHEDDGRFLARLHERLSREPVVLAPLRSPGALSSGRRWVVPVSLAAAVAAVSSVLWISRPEAPVGNGPLAAAPASAPVPLLAVESLGSAPIALQPAMVRSEVAQQVEFEPYVSAHRQFGPVAAHGPDTGFLRNAVHESR